MSICRDIERIIARYWWSNGAGGGIHWKKWSELCRSKFDGGMGFRELTFFNQALLCKQAWRLLEFPTSLLAKMFKARYYAESDFMEADSGHYPSFLRILGVPFCGVVRC